MKISKIVITGGPCGGKSSAQPYIKSYFEAKGYTVLFIPETATELIGGGVAPWTCGRNVDHQKCQMHLQTVKEEVFAYAASTMPTDKVLLICDRGTIDNLAYMNKEEYAEVQAYMGETAVSLRDRYDAVFHLVTAAKGAEDHYTTDNNTARTETAEQAILLDDKILAVWVGHPHLRIIDNRTNFEEKMQRLLAEIDAFLGEDDGNTYEIERKFLIEYPDITWLDNHPFCHKTDILQTYLYSQNGEEIRIRQRGEQGEYTYFKTVKRYLSDARRVEEESRISKEEYADLLMQVDPDYRPIRKSRYLMVYEGQYLEIDLYPFMRDKAIVEVELCREDDEVVLPPELQVIREVTGDKAYRNASLAKRKEEKL